MARYVTTIMIVVHELAIFLFLKIEPLLRSEALQTKLDFPWTGSNTEIILCVSGVRFLANMSSST